MLSKQEKKLKLSQKLERYPWTNEIITTMLDLYESKIDDFLNPYKTQAKLWKELTDAMKVKLPEKLCVGLTPQKAIGKFNFLKRKFKQEFFSTEKDSRFPYYHKMNQMFNDYAMKKLNETTHDNSLIDLNLTTEEKINSIIVEALDSDFGSFSILRGGSTGIRNENSDFDNFKQPSNTQKFKSEASILKSKLRELPKQSIFIKKEKLRIDPTTPFSRHYSQTSILNQRSSIMHSYELGKRSLINDPEFQRPKKIARINSTEVNYADYSRSDFVIEALDECEISSINMRNSKGINGNSTKFQPTASSSINNFENKNTSSPKLLTTSQNISSSTQVSHDNKKMNNSSAVDSIVTEQDTIINSVVIPSFHYSSDYESDDVSSSYSIDLLRNNDEQQLIDNYNETIKSTSKAIIKPKQLLKEVQNMTLTTDKLIQKLQENSKISITRKPTPSAVCNDNDEPPKWFKIFLDQYESDMKAINSKLDKIIAINKSSAPLEHPKVTNLKLKRL